METLDKEVQEEIERFRENHLPCKKEKVCLALHLIREKASWFKYDKEKTAKYIAKGLELYGKIDEEKKKEIYEDIYEIIYVYMKDLMYPNEHDVRPECNNYRCPVHCVEKVMSNGNKYIELQFPPAETFKYKESEKEHYDIGMENALKKWIEKPITLNGKQTTLAAEYKKAYEKRELEKQQKNHSGLI
jgi:hypothetical protein